jgi:periplasmic protein TonB
MRVPICAALLTFAASAAPVFAQGAQVASSNATGQIGQAYFEFQVEKPVALRPGNPHPRYPYDMRALAREGEVAAQFVVDTSGRVDMNTVEVLKTTSPSFAASVKSVLPELRFYPAEVEGRKVRQLVQQEFRFAAASQ